MANSNNQNSSLSGLVSAYPGIEYFYFINSKGHLGYLTKDLEAVGESFDELLTNEFLELHPNFREQMNVFIQLVSNLPKIYHSVQNSGIEIGDVVTPTIYDVAWKSATLILHQPTLEELEIDSNFAYKHQQKNPFQIDADRDLEPKRSVQQGLDDLINHRNAMGANTFFPVLYLLPRESSLDIPEPEHRIRVLNLLWIPARSAVKTINYNPQDCEGVVSIMRQKLEQRGAINRDLRMENKFSID